MIIMLPWDGEIAFTPWYTKVSQTMLPLEKGILIKKEKKSYIVM